MVLLGIVAAVSLLWRHWDLITELAAEAEAEEAAQEAAAAVEPAQEPLLAEVSLSHPFGRSQQCSRVKRRVWGMCH